MTALERLTHLTQNDLQEQGLESSCQPLDLLGIDFGYGFDNPNPNTSTPANGWETHFRNWTAFLTNYRRSIYPLANSK